MMKLIFEDRSCFVFFYYGYDRLGIKVIGYNKLRFFCLCYILFSLLFVNLNKVREIFFDIDFEFV